VQPRLFTVRVHEGQIRAMVAVESSIPVGTHFQKLNFINHPTDIITWNPWDDSLSVYLAWKKIFKLIWLWDLRKSKIKMNQLGFST
jgi:hypothetical protein